MGGMWIGPRSTQYENMQSVPEVVNVGPGRPRTLCCTALDVTQSVPFFFPFLDPVGSGADKKRPSSGVIAQEGACT